MIGVSLVLLAVAELAAFGLFWFDKARARDHGRRVRESILLLASLFGGVGAWAGQRLLRHKTRKEPFRTRLGMAVVVHLMGVGVVSWLLLRPVG